METKARKALRYGTMDSRGNGPMIKAIVAFIAFVALVIGLFVIAWNHDERECAEKGGHLISKSGYKTTIVFCIDDEGRILE